MTATLSLAHIHRAMASDPNDELALAVDRNSPSRRVIGLKPLNPSR